MTEKIKKLIDDLKKARKHETDAIKAVYECQDHLQATEEYAQLVEAKEYLTKVQQAVKKTDGILREAAISEYKSDGNKKPADGVSVVINKKLVYDPGKALEWCVNTHSFVFLKLDESGFEKHARAVCATLPFDFLEIKEVPSVKIAKDL